MTDRDTQQRIIEDLEVVADFDAACETERRIRFLAEYVQHTGTQGLVLGVSGGVDSTVAGRLCQLACERVRAQGGDAAFVAIRLPYGVQKDEADANQAVAAIAADEVYTVNIKGVVDGMWDACLAAGISIADERDDFVKGNVKARERMIAQYTVAGARNMLVVGTDQAAEAVVGFFTKYGDGAADLTPLYRPPEAPGPRHRPAPWHPGEPHREGAHRRPGGGQAAHPRRDGPRRSLRRRRRLPRGRRRRPCRRGDDPRLVPAHRTQAGAARHPGWLGGLARRLIRRR